MIEEEGGVTTRSIVEVMVSERETYNGVATRLTVKVIVMEKEANSGIVRRQGGVDHG